MLLDTNIVIYAASPDKPDLLQPVGDPNSAVSLVSYIEALGYWKLGPTERGTLARFFAAMEVLPIPDLVAQAVRLRQQRKISLGDSIVAGTALVHGRTLVTR